MKIFVRLIFGCLLISALGCEEGSAGSQNGDENSGETPVEVSCDPCGQELGDLCRVGPPCTTSADCPNGTMLRLDSMLSMAMMTLPSDLPRDAIPVGVYVSECVEGICMKATAPCDSAEDCKEQCKETTFDELSCLDVEECIAFYEATGLEDLLEGELTCKMTNQGKFACETEPCDGVKRCTRYRACETTDDCPISDEFNTYSCDGGRCRQTITQCETATECESLCEAAHAELEARSPGPVSFSPLSDCTAGSLTCVNTPCGGNSCQPTVMLQCATDADCGFGGGLWECNGGTCIPLVECTSGAECDAHCSSNYAKHPAGVEAFCGGGAVFQCDNPF